MDRGAWGATAHRVAKNQTRLSSDTKTLQTTQVLLLLVKKPPANAGDIRDMSLICSLGQCPGGGQ